MHIDDWPLYINDYGNIFCYQPGCDDDVFTDAKMEIARRTNFGEFKRMLIMHARTCHSIELTESKAK